MPDYNSGRRLSQRDLAPSAVRQRNLLQPVSIGTLASGSFTCANNARSYISLTIASDLKAPILAGEVYMSIYQDSVDGANLVPGGSAITDTNYNFVGPFFDLYNWSGNDWEIQWAVSFVNQSGSSHTFYYKLQTKYLTTTGTGV